VFRDIKHRICYGVLYLQNIIMCHGTRVAVISFMLSKSADFPNNSPTPDSLLCRNSLKSGKRPHVASSDRNALTFPSKERLVARYVKGTRTTSRNAYGHLSTPILCKSEEQCPSFYRLPPSPKIFNYIMLRSSTSNFTQTGQPIRNAAAPIH
jgi:hypothetical protein